MAGCKSNYSAVQSLLNHIESIHLARESAGEGGQPQATGVLSETTPLERRGLAGACTSSPRVERQRKKPSKNSPKIALYRPTAEGGRGVKISLPINQSEQSHFFGENFLPRQPTTFWGICQNTQIVGRKYRLSSSSWKMVFLWKINSSHLSGIERHPMKSQRTIREWLRLWTRSTTKQRKRKSSLMLEIP